MRTDVNTLVFEVAKYLESSGIGTLGQTIFYRSMPNSPVKSVAVLAASSPVDRINPMSQLGFQVLVRDTSLGDGLGKSSKVFGLLHNKWAVLSTVKGYASGVNSPGPHIRDSNDIPYWSLNFLWLGQ